VECREEERGYIYCLWQLEIVILGNLESFLTCRLLQEKEFYGVVEA
jgi:hypothetical protein